MEKQKIIEEIKKQLYKIDNELIAIQEDAESYIEQTAEKYPEHRARIGYGMRELAYDESENTLAYTRKMRELIQEIINSAIDFDGYLDGVKDEVMSMCGC